jgi:hypothetical protein
MNPQVLLGILVTGMLIAFWAGGRWRHARRTWSDHKTAKALEAKLRSARWTAAGVAVVAIMVAAVYVMAVRRNEINTGEVPAQLHVPSAAPCEQRQMTHCR